MINLGQKGDEKKKDYRKAKKLEIIHYHRKIGA